MNKIVLILLLSGVILSSHAQKQTHQIKVSLEGLKDTNIFLAHYYGSKVLKTDSARLDKHGIGIFEGKKELPQGIYLIYLNDKNYFDFLLGADQQFSISASFKPETKRVFTGAKETESFQQYQEFLTKQRAKQQRFQKELELHKNNPDSVKIVNNELEALNLEMETYWENKSEEYKGTFFGDFIHSMITTRPVPVEVPSNVANADSFKWVKNYAFSRDHYWDNFNFGQPGMILTPILDSRVDTYFKKVLLQIPDSILGPTLKFIDKSKANQEMFHYLSLNRLNNALNSEIMGMDKVFVEIADRYFLKGNADWLDSTSRAKITEKVYVTKPNLIGNLAPELKLPDSEGNYYSLRQMNGNYTVLYFWEPNCSHCKKSTPLLQKNLFEPLKDKGIEIFAVCTQINKDEWMKAINEYHIHEWTNVWDPTIISNFRTLYDVFSTPVIYILNKSKHIVAKRIDVDTAVKFLKNELERTSKQ
jgi:thiol-disulfide isomerase/thioredoxin